MIIALIFRSRARAIWRAAILSTLFITLTSDAQVVAVRAGAEGKRAGGFSVRKEDDSVIEALAEFDRYVGRKEWEKAVAALGKVTESMSKGLIPTADGFYVPTRVRLRQVLADLPPAGKEAYRLFNDAKAKQQLARLDNPPELEPGVVPAPSDELAQLEEMFDLYFVTSVGDTIADRLGDAKFEAVDFSGAAACWDAILSNYPDTSLQPVRLSTKRAIALARAGRSADLKQALAHLRERFADQTVRIGGRDVVAVSYVEGLMANGGDASPEKASAVEAPAPSATALPESDDPLWQSVFADEAYFKKVRDAVNNTGWGMYAANPGSRAPSSAVDERRVYLNWFGIGMAIDAETGKLLWRTGPFNDLPQKLQNLVMSGGSADGYAITAAPAAGRVLLVHGQIDARQPATPTHLTCLSAEDGKQVWTTQSGALSDRVFVGEPLVYGATVYATARQSNAAELTLLAVALDDGKLLWQIPLGTAAPQQNFRGMMAWPRPLLRHASGTMYVNTNNGAVLAVNLGARRIEWAFTFDIPVAPNREVFYYQQTREGPVFPASLQVLGSTLFVKDKNHGQLHALDLAGPALKWRRPIDAGAMVVHVDERSVYTLGEELCCIDLASREMKWSVKTPLDSGDTRPLVAPRGTRVHLFGARGVYDVDLRDGARALFRGHDREGVGGAVWRIGDRMICVSNRAVTAYPLDGDTKGP